MSLYKAKTAPEEGISLLAPAKVNLSLEVLKKEGRYHQLDMIMAPVLLFDKITILPDDQDSIESNVFLPEKNTLSKTLEILRKHGLKGHYRIVLEKEIPEQAGLGGASADAAALLQYLVEKEELPVSREKLETIAFEIGADVVFCLDNRLARVQGFGEKVEPLSVPGLLQQRVLLAKPDFGISTPEAFAIWDQLHTEEKSSLHASRLAEKLSSCSWCLEDFEKNDLMEAACQMEPRLEKAIETLKENGARQVLMSGSGSTLMAFFDQDYLYKEVQEKLQKEFDWLKTTYILSDLDFLNPSIPAKA